jgi:hypothetical protein
MEVHLRHRLAILSQIADSHIITITVQQLALLHFACDRLLWMLCSLKIVDCILVVDEKDHCP